ncbi:MAG TPA: porin family protein [Prolixibacteraceae bacterium]|nr:porin family protein [Prolixibacteraceae bacterium]
MKRNLFLFCLLLIGLHSMAQKQVVNNLTTFDDKRLHFGFSLGVNALDFGIQHYQNMSDNVQFKPIPDPTNPTSAANEDYKYRNAIIRADVATLTPGFTVGIVTNLRLTESLDLRFLPGMSFGERKLTYNIPIQDVNNTDVKNTENYSIKSTYLDFPLLLKYKSRRMNNQRPYLIGGAAYRVDISKTGEEDLVRLKPFSTYLEAGMGWDMYLQFFRLSTELKFSFGLNNILDNGPKNTQMQVYTDAFSRVTSDIFTLSFHFE